MDKNPSKFKVIISCGSYSWGGLEMVALQNAVKLKEKGHNIKIISASESRFQSEAVSAGIDTIPIFSKDYRLLSSITKLKKLIREFNPDIIHTHLSHDLSVITPALKSAKSNAKLFLTKHMASGVKKKDIFHRYLYSRLSGIFSISNYINESVINTCPVPVSKIHILPNGIDLKEFDEAYDKSQLRTELGFPNDKILIAIIGRMTPGKGHEEFLRAMKIINQAHGDKAYYLIVGSPSFGEEEYENKIKSLAKELNIPNLMFTGYAANIPKILSAIDILAFPSHNESFGVTLLEAMASRLPVAAGGNAGVLDIVVDNETGLLVEPKNPEQLAGALIKLIEDEQLRKTLGMAGRKRVEEKFNIDNIIDKLINYYKS